MNYRICDRYTIRRLKPNRCTPNASGECRIVNGVTSRRIRSLWPIVPMPREHEALIFGSFNQFPKISDACIRLWCLILARLPAAKLRVYGVPEGRTRTAFLERLARAGLDPTRASLYGRVDVLKYFAAISDVDIALDSFPYNGATTTLDTLWMGVPLVSLRDERAIGRGSFSINSTLGAPELLATTVSEYVDKNVRLASDSAMRLLLRQTLRERLETSPLMNTEAFVEDLEHAYREMWQAWCLDQTREVPAI